MPLIDTALTILSRKLGIDFHYFIKGGFWLLLTQAITVLGSLLVATLFANQLPSADYGIYRYAVALAVLCTTFSLSGMGQALLQATAKGYYQFFTYGIRVSLIYNLGITISALLGALYYYLQGNTTLTIACFFISFLQPLISTYQNVIPFLQGLRQFKVSAQLQVYRVATITAASCISIYYTKNVLILFLVFLVAQAVSNIISVSVSTYKQNNGKILDEETRKKYLSFAKHTSVQNIIIGLATRLDNILVFQHLGAVQLAVFSVATLISDQIKGAFKNILPLLVPKFARFNTLEENRKHLPKKSFLLFIILTLISTVLVVLLPFLYKILFPTYAEAIFYSQLLMLSLPASIALIPQSALQSQLRDKELYTINLYGSLFQILVTVSLIPLLGLMGAILARIISRYVNILLTFYYLYTAK